MTVDSVGGVWQYASDLSAALRPLGIETVLASLGPVPSPAQRSELAAGTQLIDTHLDLDWLAPDVATVEAAGVAIASRARDLAVDLVHLNQPALGASASFPMPVVTTIHSCVATWWQAVVGGEAPATFAWQTGLVSRGLRRSDIVTAPSVAFAQAVQRTYALQALPHVVPNGRGQAARQTAMDDTVFTAGRLWDRGKNVGMLDRVASRIPQPFQAAGAVQGPNGERIALRHIEALGLLDASNVKAHLASRPVFVSSALYEPFGLAVLEAASAGCALVLADIPTFREIWEGAALFVPPSDEDGFVEAIQRLLRDRDTRTHRGELARDRAGRFTPEAMAAGMLAVYAQAFAGRDTTRADAA